MREFLRKWLSKMKIWGESAVPYFVAGALETEASGDQISGESLLINVLTVVLNTNGQRTVDWDDLALLLTRTGTAPDL